MYTDLGIICENALHVVSHVCIVILVGQIRSNRIVEEVVSDLVGQTGRDGIVIHLISEEMDFLFVIRELHFGQKWPYRIGDRKI